MRFFPWSSSFWTPIGQVTPKQWVYGMMGGSGLLFFLLSSLRHFLLKSDAYDLGWFDQMVYLISQGEPPIVSFSGYHLLGDHVALVLYAIALLYKLYPTVYWLFALQAIALSISCGLVWKVAQQANIPPKTAALLSGVYLLYPLVFNINLYDFHPEVLAVPAFLAAVYTARKKQFWRYCLCVVFILSCKAVLSLTVAAMGLWLFCFEKRRKYGIIALFLGGIWFLITTQLIIPHFSGEEQAAVARYAYLGDSVLEIILNLILKPQLVLGQVFSWQTAEYFLLLFAPVFWGIFPQNLTPLTAAIPALLINILSQQYVQRNLVSQYSVPILPFLLLSLITAVSLKRIWIKHHKFILGWSFVGFLFLAKWYYFGTLYIEEIDTWQANREAMSYIQTKDPVLAPAQLNPHLCHRKTIKLPFPTTQNEDLDTMKYILLDQKHPGFGSSQKVIQRLVNYLNNNDNFSKIYDKDKVVLYKKRR